MTSHPKYGIFALSITRENSIDKTSNPEWAALDLVADFKITVNLLSIFPVAISKEEIEGIVNTLLPSE